MKKIISVLIMAFATLVLAVPASAAGGVTKSEQKILDALSQGTTVSGITFNFGSENISQARNYLQQTELTDAEVEDCLANIEAARSVAMRQKIDTTGLKDGDHVSAAYARMSASAKQEMLLYYNRASQVLGITAGADKKGPIVTDKNGKPIAEVGGTGSNGSDQKTGVIKKTGANYTASLILFASLMVGSAAAVVIGKKFSEADLA